MSPIWTVCARALGDQAPELARLLPKLKSFFPALRHHSIWNPRRRGGICSIAFLTSWCASLRQQPILMILEDLHWADDSTLALLDHLTQRLSDLPLMVIGTYRDAELNVTRELAKTLEDLLRGRRASRVALSGLPRDEVAAMLNSLSGKSCRGRWLVRYTPRPAAIHSLSRSCFAIWRRRNGFTMPPDSFIPSSRLARQDAPPSVRLGGGAPAGAAQRTDAEDARDRRPYRAQFRSRNSPVGWPD